MILWLIVAAIIAAFVTAACFVGAAALAPGRGSKPSRDGAALFFTVHRHEPQVAAEPEKEPLRKKA